eukprot:2601107-Rhodomonas_salina.4
MRVGNQQHTGGQYWTSRIAIREKHNVLQYHTLSQYRTPHMTIRDVRYYHALFQYRSSHSTIR